MSQGLKNRLFARVVERLSAASFEKEGEDDNASLYHFTLNSVGGFVKIGYRKWEEGTLVIVELLDSDRTSMFREEIAGTSHPLLELVTLLREGVRDDITAINKFLGMF